MITRLIALNVLLEQSIDTAEWPEHVSIAATHQKHVHRSIISISYKRSPAATNDRTAPD